MSHRTYEPSDDRTLGRSEAGTIRPSPCLVLAHGAGAGHDHPWMRRVAQGLADRGVRVVTFNFPYTEEKRKVPDRGDVLEETFAAVWRDVASGAAGRLFAGGKSMGGRVASQLASHGGFHPAPSGLVFFGYPLHPPAMPRRRRDSHLPDIAVPMLFLQGTRDSFGSPEEMRGLVDRLPHATLELIDAGDHSLIAPKRRDPEGTSLALAIGRAAAWILMTD